MTRSLRKYTLPSIQKNVLEAIANDPRQPIVRKFVQTVRLEGGYKNAHAGEAGVVDNDEFRLLEPTRFHVQSNPTGEELGIDRFAKHGSAFVQHGDGGMATTINLVRQYQSLQLLWEMIEDFSAETGEEPDAIVFVRPDVEFVDPLRLPDTLPIPPNTIYVPNWDTYETDSGKVFDKRPITNDRFAMGGTTAMRVFAHRHQSAECWANHFKVGVHSESVLHFLIVERFGLRVVFTPELRFARRRLNGAVAQYDKMRFCGPWPSKKWYLPDGCPKHWK